MADHAAPPAHGAAPWVSGHRSPELQVSDGLSSLRVLARQPTSRHIYAGDAVGDTSPADLSDANTRRPMVKNDKPATRHSTPAVQNAVR